MVLVIEDAVITNLTTNQNSLVVDLPAGIALNDLIYVIQGLDGNGGNAQLPIEYTRIVAQNSQGNTGCEMFVWWKRATASEPSTVNMTWTGNEQCRVVVLRISGAILTGDPIDIVGVIATAQATNITAAAIISTVIDTLALANFVADSSRISASSFLSAVAGFTNETVVPGSSGGPFGCGVAIYDKDLPAIGSSDSPTFDTNNTIDDALLGVIINIKPASAPPAGFAHSQAVIVG